MQKVFDVGMNNGDDTAYYLHRGFDVVAVEANPALCAVARTRFDEQVRSGRLVIENVGIASASGEMTFWVSDHSEWSSFRETSATKGNAKATPIAVKTIRFGELLRDHGVPSFAKIDIEGHDRLCLEDMTPSLRPRYVSVEMSHPDGDVDINRLDQLGYETFKCVRQNDFVEINPDNISSQLRRRRLLSRLGTFEGRVRGLIRRRVSSDGWQLPYGGSGPVPWELPGRWLSQAEVLAIWRQLRDVDAELNDKGLGEWFDIHAMCEAATEGFIS
jgi:FkbM family methyltransferase